MEKVNLAEKLASFTDHWNPRILAELNGQHVKLVKFAGPFTWHFHALEDELFLVLRGSFAPRARGEDSRRACSPSSTTGVSPAPPRPLAMDRPSVVRSHDLAEHSTSAELLVTERRHPSPPALFAAIAAAGLVLACGGSGAAPPPASPEGQTPPRPAPAGDPPGGVSPSDGGAPPQGGGSPSPGGTSPQDDPSAAGDPGVPGAPSPTQVPGQGAGATDPPPPEAVAVPARTSGVRCATDCLYVDGRSGSDARDGRTPATALATLQRAADAARPGTTVLVMGGVYTSDGSRPPLTISASGSPDAWVTFAAAPGEHVVIQIPRGGGATAGVHLRGASYIVIDGFEVVGQNATITPAEAAANDGTQAFLNENCIYVDGQGFAGSHPPVPHDIVIRNSTLHGCSAAGIEANVADGLTIAYNEVYDDAWWTVFGTSGIGLYHLTDAPGAPRGGGYRNLIVGNVVHHNRNNLPFRAGTPPAIYDGNGIIVDDARHAQAAVGVADVQGVPYSGRTYIANNVVHDNGGHGIHVFSSDHVDIVNNTAFNDLLSDSEFISPGTIDAQACSDVNVVNNVAILRSAKSVNVEDGGAWDYNVLDGANAVARGAHDVHADAGLRDPAHGDFAPGPGSPALGTGTTRLAPTLDANGRARVWTAIDRGAIQVSR